MNKSSNIFTVLLDGVKQVDVRADDYTIEAEGNETYVRFWNQIPGDRQSDECEDVAVFTLKNIVGFIEVAMQ